MATAADVRDLLAVLKDAGVGHYEEHPNGKVKSVTFGQSLNPAPVKVHDAQDDALAALVDLSNQARAERQ